MSALDFSGRWRRRRRLLRAALVFALVFSFWTVSLRTSVPIVQGAVITVPGDYGNIQAAVDAASAGDTIEVSAGVYYENVTIEKSLTLRGEDKYTTIIDAIGRGFNVVEFKQDSTTVSVTISGFTIRNGGSNAGIRATECGGHTIIDNIISGNAIGISLSSATSGSLIANNTIVKNDMGGVNILFSSDNNINNNNISDSTYGIRLDNTCDDNTITDNRILEISYGVRVENSLNNDVDRNDVSACRLVGIYSLYSDSTDIRNNTVSECAYGIELYGSANNIVTGNTASSSGYGIYLVSSNTNTFDSNLVSNSDWGIHLYGSESNTLIQNTLSYGTHGIKLVSSSTGNVIAWNNMLNNTQQKYQDGTSAANTWHRSNGTGTYGNYWSDYTGEDGNGDGVGDTPYGPDQYPLMEPWSAVHDVAIVSVEALPTTVFEGEIVNITVVARNEGTAMENFTITVKYYDAPIGTQAVLNLPFGSSIILGFSWDTTDVMDDFSYTIKAEANEVEGETDKVDNIFVDGKVYVAPIRIGDVNDDGIVDVYDLSDLSKAYGSELGEPNWNEACDLNLDDKVDDSDLLTLTNNYGKSAN